MKLAPIIPILESCEDQGCNSNHSSANVMMKAVWNSGKRLVKGLCQQQQSTGLMSVQMETSKI